MLISRFDLNSSFLIVFLSISIYIYQVISDQQLLSININGTIYVLFIIGVIFLSFWQLIPIYIFAVDILYHQGSPKKRTKKEKIKLRSVSVLPTFLILLFSMFRNDFLLLWINLGSLFVFLVFSLIIEGSARTPHR